MIFWALLILLVVFCYISVVGEIWIGPSDEKP